MIDLEKAKKSRYFNVGDEIFIVKSEQKSLSSLEKISFYRDEIEEVREGKNGFEYKITGVDCLLSNAKGKKFNRAENMYNWIFENTGFNINGYERLNQNKK